MSLAKRQAAAINQIIQEEIQGALKGRKSRAGLLRRGELQERLVEAGPDAMRVDASIMDEQLKEAANDAGMDMADDLIYKFRQKILRFIAGQLNQHGMSAVKVDPRTFPSEVEEFDEDGTYEASMECMSDVTAALEKYALALGNLGVMMAGGREADEEEFEG